MYTEFSVSMYSLSLVHALENRAIGTRKITNCSRLDLVDQKLCQQTYTCEKAMHESRLEAFAAVNLKFNDMS